MNRLTKGTYKHSLATAELKRTPVKKHIGPPLPKNGVSVKCGRGIHSECYAITCKCKKCDCKENP
jgi:hypothetical protein